MTYCRGCLIRSNSYPQQNWVVYTCGLYEVPSSRQGQLCWYRSRFNCSDIPATYVHMHSTSDTNAIHILYTIYWTTFTIKDICTSNLIANNSFTDQQPCQGRPQTLTPLYSLQADGHCSDGSLMLRKATRCQSPGPHLGDGSECWSALTLLSVYDKLLTTSLSCEFSVLICICISPDILWQSCSWELTFTRATWFDVDSAIATSDANRSKTIKDTIYSYQARFCRVWNRRLNQVCISCTQLQLLVIIGNFLMAFSKSFILDLLFIFNNFLFSFTILILHSMCIDLICSEHCIQIIRLTKYYSVLLC